MPSTRVSLMIIAALLVSGCLLPVEPPQTPEPTPPVTAQPTTSPDQPTGLADFAQCLTDRGIKVYTAWWAEYSDRQKELFGDSWKYVASIECSPPNSREWTSVCSEAGVTGVPTWQSADGRKILGMATLAQLAQFSGCALPLTTSPPLSTAPPTTTPPKTLTPTLPPPPTSVPPSANGTITGTVTSASSGAKIAGASVSVGGVTTTTNAAGSYSIRLASGDYTVTISAAGYIISSSAVTVSSGAVATKNLALSPAIANGDVNGDGGTNILDSLFISQTTAGLRTMTPAQFAASDINSDGVVNDVDALYISEFSVGSRKLQSAASLSASASPNPYPVSVGSATIPSGGTTTVSINVAGVTADVAAATVRLAFDPAVIAVSSVDAGDLGMPTSAIDNSAGTVDISVFSTTPKSKTPVVIANVVLRAVTGVSEGTSPLTLTVQTLSDSDGNNRVPDKSGITSATASVTAAVLVNSIYAWGSNYYGQLGDDGTTTNRVTPGQVSGLTDVIAVAGGNGHTLALKSDGTVWTWGWNNYGQLGDGTNTNRLVPVQVNGITDVSAVASGYGHTLALKSDGTVWTWGYNAAGQLGDGTKTTRFTPVEVSGISSITAIAGGSGHSVALKSDGTVWTWGTNNDGQLGDNSTNNSLTPIQVNGLTDVTAVASGDRHSVALKSDGTVWTWGWNFYGQLGAGTINLFNNKLTPVQVSGLTGVTAIAAGDTHTIALKADGTVWTWGDNRYAQLGGDTAFYETKRDPVMVSGITDVTAIAGGGRHTIALKKDGTAWAWGDFGSGQLGDGSGLAPGVFRMGPSGKSTPAKVSELTGITAISGGNSHTIALAPASVSAPTTTARIESGSSGTSVCKASAGTDTGYVRLTASAGYISVGQTMDFTASPLTPTEKNVTLRWWLDDHGHGGYLVPQGCTARYYAPANLGTAYRDFFDVAVAKDGQVRPGCFSSWCDGTGGLDRSYLYDSSNVGDQYCSGNVWIDVHPSHGAITGVTFKGVGFWLVFGLPNNVQIGPVPKGLYTVWVTTTTEQLVANNVRVDCNDKNYIYFKS